MEIAHVFCWYNNIYILIFFQSKFLDPNLQHFIDWSKPIARNRHTFRVLRKLRQRRLYQQQMKVYRGGNSGGQDNSGVHSIIWELENIDAKIRTIQTEINVLQVQLQIIQSGSVATATKTLGQLSSSGNQSGDQQSTRFDSSRLLCLFVDFIFLLFFKTFV